MPRFSIVVPAYNAESTLTETLDAVHAQHSADWECVIVDDGSTDATRQIAEGYAARDARFRVLHQQNAGAGGAYNAGVGAATGDFVVICSADDLLLPEHLAEMGAFVDAEPEYDIYSSNGYFLLPDGSLQLCYAPEVRGSVSSVSLSELIMWCFYSVGATYRRDLFTRIGGYRTDVFGEDYDFWLRALASGARHRYTPQPLSAHRKSETQKSANVERAYLSDIRLVSDLRRDYPLLSNELDAVENSIRTRERLIADLSGADGATETPSTEAPVPAAALPSKEPPVAPDALMSRRVSTRERIWAIGVSVVGEKAMERLARTFRRLSRRSGNR